MSLNYQVKHALNAEFTSLIGAITGRKGSLVQSTVVAADEVLNLLQYRKNDGTVTYFAVSDDSAGTPKVDVYKSATGGFAGAWSKSLEDRTTDTDTWGVNFINKLGVFNGVDAPTMYNGSSWSAITNAPATGNFPEVYNQRLFCITAAGILWYSDVVNSAGTDFTTTDWTSRGINPNDGQTVNMMKRHRSRLVILKNESIYRYDGTNEPEAVITIGTHSGKSVVILGDLFFHHPTGIHKMGAGEPTIISRAVQKYLDGMSSDNWAQVAGGRDLENVYFWIGDVTINDPLEHDYDRTYTDVVLVYNVYSQVWSVYTGWNAMVWFWNETDGATYFGKADGKIVKINTAYADVDGATTTPINFEVIFTPENYGYPEKYKEFEQVFLLGRHNADITVGKDFDSMENVSQIENKEGIVNSKITCKELWVGVSESYADTPPRIEGLVFDNTNLLNDAK